MPCLGLTDRAACSSSLRNEGEPRFNSMNQPYITPRNDDGAWDVYIIQHSHIDLGFTDRQEMITEYHCQFLS